MAWSFEQSSAGYANLWRGAQIKVGADLENADRFAAKIITNEMRYRTVQVATGVPWFFIAALHMRESSCNFDGILHNGEHIIGTGRVTTLVPSGVGPFATWEESAVHALKSKDLHRVQDWSIERMLYSAEAYNGWGYAGKVNSPYVWAGTTREQSGKYVRDHVFDASVEDTQLGVAAILKRLAEKRPDIAALLQSDDDGAGEVTILPPAPQLPATISPALQQLLQTGLPLLLLALQQRVASGSTAAGSPPGTDSLAAIFTALTSTAISPVPQPAPKPIEAVKPAVDTTPSMQRPSVQMSLIALAGSIIGMFIPGSGGEALIGTPFGMGTMPTTAGTLSVLLPAISAVLGGAGIYGRIASVGLNIAGALLKDRLPK